MTADTVQTLEAPPLDDSLAAGVRRVRAYFDASNYLDALDTCEALLAQHPGSAEAILLLGLISYELEETQRALILLRQAHDLAPRVREFADALASVNAQLGNDAEALYYAKLAAVLQPHWLGDDLLPDIYSKFFFNLQNAKPHRFRDRARHQLAKGDAEGAMAACDKQLDLTPDDTGTRRLLAHAALAAGKTARVIDAFEHLADDGLTADDYDVLAQALALAGDYAQAESAHQNAIAAEPDNPAWRQSRIRTLAARHGNAGSVLQAENEAWAARFARPSGALPQASRAAAQDRPLRVGYVGGALHGGDLVELLTPILAHHDRRQVAAYCYAANARYDMASEGLAARCARWTDIHGVDPVTAAEILRGDGIDIAVDLSGHGPNSQLQMFAERPAPVCVSWLGTAMPAGTGFDFLMTCDTLVPADSAPVTTAHAVYRLPGAHLAHRPLDAPKAVAPPPALDQPAFTIGVMAPLAELDEAFVQQWAGILDTIVNARIVVANVVRVDDPAVHRIYRMAAAAGIRERVMVADLEAVDPAGYGFFEHFDILLDPQPNSRFLESCRALWMGVPVLALAGDGIAGRQAAAALSAAGRPDWIFASEAARTAAVAEMAADLDRLAVTRMTLRDHVAATPLCDVAAFARALEQAYRAM